MRICTKCKIEKEDDQYYTYYHSVQKKYRTRHVCRSCRQIQAAAYRMKIKQDYIKCTMCGEKKHITQYYNHRQQCKECCRKIDKEIREREIAEAGGSSYVPQQVGVYRDEYQKVNLKKLLISMGWSYNETNNIFYKLPLKDENGVWHFTRPSKKTVKDFKDQYKRFRATVTLDTLPKFRYKNNVRNGFTEDFINNIVKEHIIDGRTSKFLAKKYNVTQHQVVYWCVQVMQMELK